MKFGSDPTITVENNGCNQGVQVGSNTGTINFNQTLSTEAMEQLASAVANEVKKQTVPTVQKQTDGEPVEKQRWFRSDTGEEVLPNQLVKTENATLQLDGNIGRMEMVMPDGKSMYVEYDIEKNAIFSLKADGYPQEYSLDIQDRIKLSMERFHAKINGKNCYVEKYTLKFGGFLLAVYDEENRILQHVEAKAPAGMKCFASPIEKKITFIKD